jgi:hypothetical protein
LVPDAADEEEACEEGVPGEPDEEPDAEADDGDA